jgi:hypothetical protein
LFDIYLDRLAIYDCFVDTFLAVLFHSLCVFISKADVKSWLSDMMDPANKARIKDKLSEVQCPTDSISDGRSLVEDLDTLLDLQEGVSRRYYR